MCIRDRNGIAWRQTIFYPFYHASCYGRGTVLQLAIDSPKHETSGHGSITDVEAVAVWNEEAEEVTVFAVNRNLEEDLPLTCLLYTSQHGIHILVLCERHR